MGSLELLQKIEVAGMPIMQVLIIEGTIVYPTFHRDAFTAKFGNVVVFRDAEFRESLDYIAIAIQAFHLDAEARKVLPSLHD